MRRKHAKEKLFLDILRWFCCLFYGFSLIHNFKSELDDVDIKINHLPGGILSFKTWKKVVLI